jgi:hypothetical protein
MHIEHKTSIRKIEAAEGLRPAPVELLSIGRREALKRRGPFKPHSRLILSTLLSWPMFGATPADLEAERYNRAWRELNESGILRRELTHKIKNSLYPVSARV